VNVYPLMVDGLPSSGVISMAEDNLSVLTDVPYNLVKEGSIKLLPGLNRPEGQIMKVSKGE